MEKFQLSLLFKIIGIGSASGLVYNEQKLYIISDNSSYLYQYNIENNSLNKIALVKKPEENIIKSEKPDFESITKQNDSLFIFGSGSTIKRNQLVHFDTKSNVVLSTINVGDLYLAMQNFGDIKPEDFNIEGAIHHKNTTYFFNRGNGKTNKNVLFTVDGNYLTEEFRIIANNYKLPKIKGVRTSFTDAVLVENTIYFLATAEDTTSTYDDGEVLGSIIGTINLETMKMGKTIKISTSHKFEGITLYSNDKDEISFLLCEDNDTEILESYIYKLILKK
jgi:hypothetical protein